MNPLSKRLAVLEQGHSPIVTLESSTAELARFLAGVPFAQLMGELSHFTAEGRAEVLEEIRAHVPGYGAKLKKPDVKEVHDECS